MGPSEEVVWSGYNSCQSMLCPARFHERDWLGRRTASGSRFPRPTNRGWHRAPFLFSDGRIHRISIRKVMKSGASLIFKHISSLPVVRWGDGRETRAVTERGTALSPRPDHLQPNRIGSGTMRCRKRVSERLQRASAHYATRTAFLLQERGVRPLSWAKSWRPHPSSSPSRKHLGPARDCLEKLYTIELINVQGRPVSSRPILIEQKNRRERRLFLFSCVIIVLI